MAQNETRRGTRVAPAATPVTAPGGGVVVKGAGQTVQAMMRTNDLRGGGGRNLTQMASSAVVRTAPKVYSPLYEMSNLMLPRDLRTMNAWIRHFYNTNPIVRNAINLHATYPISKFEITCRDPKVKNFFIDQADHIDLMGVLLSASLEFWKHGEVFPYSELDENKGWWDYIFMHNPDYIRVKTNVLTREPIITLVPDDALRRLAQTQNAADRALREQLPQDILYHLKRGEDIPLPNFNVAHLKMLSSDYDIRGTSLIVSVFKDLMLYDKIREAKLAQADNFINPITLVKLGDPTGTWKPNDQDIVNFRNAWMESTYDPDAKLITHGAVTVEKVSNAGQTLDMASDLELIIKNLYAGLMMPEAIMNGEGATYNSASIGLEVLRARYERFRNLITRWVMKKVFEPISKIQDFYEYKDGEKKLIVPEVQWNKINLKDVDSYWTAVSSLMSEEAGKSRVSKRTAFGILDIDPDSEEQNLKEEAVRDLIRNKEIERLSKMTVEELKTLDLTKPIPDMHPDQAAGGGEGAEGAEGEEGLGDLGGGGEPSGLGGGFDLGSLGGGEEGGGEAGGEAPAPAPAAPAAPAGGE